ncbi:hypothetical protein ASE04_18685 [Rhizobium sp. Root708]|uniref:hypothetical protein n=1 Tax=Rhizobium sp. Root708 TaxID=1736592 RepID=UPI0006F338BF|nr:hypothetical protein [Rhizobium sp. Root708]KRB49205.1 hypothetical protein ASE04_18685 [Rhizobium sp. Root708]
MSENEIPKLIETLRLALQMAEKEEDGEVLSFLIQQAIGEAISEARRRGQAVTPKPTAGMQ